MKKTITLLLLAVSFCGLAQPGIDWQKCFGGSSHDTAYDMIATNDGGFMVAGLSMSGDGQVSNNHGGSDFWLVRTDAAGNLQWQKCYGGTQNDWLMSIIQTADDGFLMVGNTFSTDNHAIGNHGMKDAFAIQTDAAGNVLWSKCYGGTQQDEFHSVKQLADGSYVIAGETLSNNGDVTFNHGASGTSDAWLVHLDPAGNILWQKTYGSSGTENFKHVALAADGGFVLTGENTTTDFTADVTTNYGLMDIWVMKTDVSGNVQWQKSYGGSMYDFGTSIKQIDDGGYIFTSVSRSVDADGTKTNDAELWVVKTDANGNVIWQKAFGGWQNEGISSVPYYHHMMAEMPDGNYIFSTNTYSFIPGINHGISDFWVIKVNPQGEMIWQKCLGGTDSDIPAAIVKTNDDAVIICGSTLSNNGDVSGAHGNLDMWLVKLLPETALATSSFETPVLQLYPNPVQSVLHLKLPAGMQPDNIAISDISGKPVLQAQSVSTLDVGQLNAGTYLLEVISKVQKFQTKFIKQ